MFKLKTSQFWRDNENSKKGGGMGRSNGYGPTTYMGQTRREIRV